MSQHDKTYNGLIVISHKDKTVTQVRDLNPPSVNARFRDKIRREYPDYKLK